MHTCRLCGSSDLEPVLDLGKQPIAHRLLKTQDEPEETFGFALHACGTCGLTQILEPIDPEILYRGYNFNFSSWKPEPHMPAELDTIVELKNPKSALEIGTNDGLFLSELRARGVETLVGIEPNPVPAKIARERGLQVFNDMVDERLVDRAVAEHGRFDLVCSRQVMEHIPNLDKYFACIDRALADDGLLFVDVPDFQPAEAQGDVSMLWEEHVSYFTERTVADLFARHGFRIVSVARYNFSGGCLTVAARRGEATVDAGDTAAAVAAAKGFGGKVRDYGARLVPALERARDKGHEIAIYGAGCRACGFLNAHGLTRATVDWSLDDQKERHGYFLPGSRIPVVGPETLAERSSPLVCLLAVNGENEEKVMARLTGLVDRPVTFVGPFVPNDIWAELEKLEAL